MENTLAPFDPKNLQKFTNFMVFDVEMKDGTITQVVTFFDTHEVGYEEIQIGMKKTLEFCSLTKKFNTSMFRLKNNNILSTGLGFFEEIIKHYKPSF